MCSFFVLGRQVRTMHSAGGFRGTRLSRMPILIDGNAFSHRWYHRWAHMAKTHKERAPKPENFAKSNARSLIALAHSLREADVLDGVCLINAVPHAQLIDRPNQIAVFFDFGDGGRTAFFPDYKKERRQRQRDPILDIFFDEAKSVYRAQPDNTCVVVPDLNQPLIDELDAEADDMISTTSVALRKRQIPHAIFSHDIDLMHLVHDEAPRVVQYDPRTKRVLGAAAVEERVGVPPHQIVDFKSLGGDRGDGIPGMPHIGPKRASTLLKKYGTLDQVFERAADEESGKKIKQYLREGKDQALLSKRLVMHKEVDLVLPIVFPVLGIHL
jgi:5'-3' exonuclease